MPLDNAKATMPNGDLKAIPDCELIIPGVPFVLNGTQNGQIVFNNLPDITDQKGATYNDEPVIGRALPIKTFSQGENRTISMTVNFFTLKRGDEDTNLKILRAIQSATYPRDGNGSMPYFPPPVCKIKCGKLLSRTHLCVVMKDYNVKFPTDVPWNQNSCLPYRVEVSMTFDVVFPSSKLPGQEMILADL